jgi:hypothetical protein
MIGQGKTWFQSEKAVKLWLGQDAMGKGWKVAIQVELGADVVDLGCQWLVLAGERPNIYQQLLRHHEFP